MTAIYLSGGLIILLIYGASIHWSTRPNTHVSHGVAALVAVLLVVWTISLTTHHPIESAVHV